VNVTAYKLMRRDRQGQLHPLFIDRASVIPEGEWLECGTHPRKGYAVRTGWHACQTPHAPHLMRRDGSMMPGRVWVKVWLRNATLYDRPESQGGAWYLATHMRVVEVL